MKKFYKKIITKRNSTAYSAFFVLFGALLFNVSSVYAVPAPAPVPEVMTIPHTLPFNDGTKTWSEFLASRTGTGSSNWVIYYHNCSNVIFMTSGVVAPTTCIDDEFSAFTSTNNGATWTEDNIYNFAESDDYYQVFNITSMGYQDSAKNNWFANKTILVAEAQPEYPGNTYWLDLYPISLGDVAVNRVNFDDEGNLIGVSSFDYDLLRGGSDVEYVDVPNPLTDPFGFVVAVLKNLSIWLYSLVIPDDGFYQGIMTQFNQDFEEKQPGLSALRTSVSNGIASMSAVSPEGIGLPSLTGMGQELGPQTLISADISPDIINPIKILISAFLYMYVAVWVVRHLSTIFSS